MLKRRSTTNQPHPESTQTATPDVQELIARRAYELYQSRGATPGDELTDWLMAEREILADNPRLEPKAADTIKSVDLAAAREPRKKSAKMIPIGGSPKEASSTRPRAPLKPKAVHP